MPAVNLFPRDQIIGVFRGFREGGLEFHADLVLPYRNEFQSIPMQGQFVLVQLETPDEAVLGRITSFSSGGKLTSSSGEEFTIRAMRDARPVPEDLREQYLRYQVSIRVLGVLRREPQGRIGFVPSQRRLPHVGSPVAFPSPEVLQEIAGHKDCEGVPIGHLALGEYVFAGSSQALRPEPWMQVKEPEILVRFHIDSLVSRRSFIFARAGFGKSNLNKLLFSALYRETPTVEKRGGRRVPVGTVIFDPDGEYFWPDDKGRPGLCDVPELQDKLVVFTSRQGPSAFYQSFVAGGIKLDIRRLRPADVIGIALDRERQEQQNVRRLRGLNQEDWENLVNIIDKDRYQADEEEVRRILNLDKNQQAELLAAIANMTTIVSSLHDKNSLFMDMLIGALREGKLCVVDLSQMRRAQSLILSGIILRRIFDRNQQAFTTADQATIPTIAVIEEAQAVLDERASAAEPYITWVKEGRKYDLGAVLITQQPGSIPTEILSQGDNWFIFHLLSAADLGNVQRANAHFSQDLLATLLNEPIPGHGVFWSSAGGRAYPLPVRVLSFENMVTVRDPNYELGAVDTFASQLRKRHAEAMRTTAPTVTSVASTLFPVQQGLDGIGTGSSYSVETVEAEPIDIVAELERLAVRAIQENVELVARLQADGVPWRRVLVTIEENLPPTIEDRGEEAHRLVPRALTKIYGPQDQGWYSFINPRTGKRWVKAGRKEGGD